MSWITPVTDRTQADIDNKVSKAYLNYSDLNRIESDTEYIRSALINTCALIVPTMTIKTNWIEADMIYLIDLERIRSNISILKSLWYSTTTIPTVLSPSYLKFNDIEQILNENKTAIDNAIQAFNYCGDLFTGEI